MWAALIYGIVLSAIPLATSCVAARLKDFFVSGMYAGGAALMLCLVILILCSAPSDNLKEVLLWVASIFEVTAIALLCYAFIANRHKQF